MSTMTPTVERWGMFEVVLPGPSDGNPFLDVPLSAAFRFQNRVVEAPGFYDGDGRYRVRFMPDEIGEWTYQTRSSHPALNGIEGQLACAGPSAANHGPVRVSSTFHFSYADGNPYIPVGTTCYVWNHQGEAMETQTLETLRSAPFNKMRMCVFPKHYAFNENEPPLHLFEGTGPGAWDFTRFNPAFFQHLERRVGDLMDLGIEADLILFHPYDRWGYSALPAEVDDRYLRYLVARLWAYRNVWWSMANEYDFMPAKSLLDWERFFKIVQESDPAQHLRSIHNGTRMYEHASPWVTHCSIQHHELQNVSRWREQFRKPVVVDECGYEGNIEFMWGDLSAPELVDRFWHGFARGGYVGHGETYLHPQDLLWWSKGGELRGESPARIAFLRRIWEEGPAAPEPDRADWNNSTRVGKPPEYFIQYFGTHAPGRRRLDLPEETRYRAEIIDAWEMTVTPVEGEFGNGDYLALPGKPYTAIRLRRVS